MRACEILCTNCQDRFTLFIYLFFSVALRNIELIFPLFHTTNESHGIFLRHRYSHLLFLDNKEKTDYLFLNNIPK